METTARQASGADEPGLGCALGAKDTAVDLVRTDRRWWWRYIGASKAGLWALFLQAGVEGESSDVAQKGVTMQVRGRSTRGRRKQRLMEREQVANELVG